MTVVLAPGWGGALARLTGGIHSSDMSILSLSQLSAAYHAAALEAARTPSWTMIGGSKPWFMANMLGWEYYSRIADAVMVGLLAPLGFCIGVWTTHLAPRRRVVTRVAAGAALLFVLLVTMAISRELSLQKQLDPGAMAFLAVGEVCLILGVLAGPTAVWRLNANRA